MKRSLCVIVALTLACDGGESNTMIANGTLEVREVDVAPFVTARVERMLVDDGDTVREGDTLAILAQPASGAELSQRQAGVAASRAGLAELESGSREAEINRAAAELRALDAEATRTAADARRAARLFEAGAIAQQQLDVANTAARAAAARRDAARQSLLLLRQGPRSERIASAQANVEAARASLQAAAATVNAMTLLSPMNGVVLSRNAEPGEIAAAGQSVVTVGEIRRPWVRVYVSAVDLPWIVVGSAVRAAIDGMPARSFSGRVVAIARKAEFTPRVALTEEERADLMFGVKIEFDDSTGVLRPGLPVVVTIPKTVRRK